MEDGNSEPRDLGRAFRSFSNVALPALVRPAIVILVAALILSLVPAGGDAQPGRIDPQAQIIVPSSGNTDPQGMNPHVRMAIDVTVGGPIRQCPVLAEAYPSCDSIEIYSPETGDFEAVVVLYGFRRAKAVEFWLSWPEEWDVYEFSSCADFTIGADVTDNPMDVAQAWIDPLRASGTEGLPLGILRGHAAAPGCISILDPDPPAVRLAVIDEIGVYQPIIEWFDACLGTPAPGDVCAFDSTLVADFLAYPHTVEPTPFNVSFLDLSLGTPLTWFWDFGDGETSTEEDPVHLYDHCGVYTVSLEITDDQAVDDTVRFDYIVATDPLIAGFTASPTGGCPPLGVQFTDLSIGEPLEWIWLFGDGQASSEQNPYHVYESAGLYDVKLVVSGVCSTDVLTLDEYIDTRYQQDIDFTADPTHGCTPLGVQFTDLSDTSIVAWRWEFGDGGYSYHQNPYHVYHDPGFYTVSLTGVGPCSSATLTREDFIDARGLGIGSVNFSAEPTQGCVPLGVQFTDLSDPLVTAWAWDFGDGESSYEQHPFHVYETGGRYDVTLTAADACTTLSLTRWNLIDALGAPLVDFAADTTGGCIPLGVQFTDLTEGSPISWLWDFGDGGSSTARNPFHTYESGGSFDVSLTAANGCSTASLTKAGYIRTLQLQTADFIAEPTAGCVPLGVQFTDLSDSLATSWLWDFGDGETSEQQNPLHIYDSGGSYDVTLTVSGACSTATIIREKYIESYGPQWVEFAAEPTAGCYPLSVQFVDLSDTLVASWLWEFGDGETSTEKDPVHVYQLPGDFSVTLTVSDTCGPATLTKEDLIRTDGGPQVGFVGLPSEGCAPLIVHFYDQSDSTCREWFWEFGDGDTSTARNPIHLYHEAGTYDVTLTAANACTESSLTRADYIDALPPPEADFTAEPTDGCAPLAVQFTNLSDPVFAGYTWRFGDGGTSTHPNPLHVYESPGTYDVTLIGFIFSGGCPADSITREGFIRVGGPSWVDFTAEPTEGCTPLAVQFTDLSDTLVAEWLWDFGDGDTSTAQNPLHVYQESGAFDVTLTVADSCTTASLTRTELIITDAQLPPVDFTAEPTAACAPLEVQFVDRSGPTVTSWLWDFGDGETSAEQSPLHSYFDRSTYTVSLTVWNSCGSSETTKVDMIRGDLPPGPDFWIYDQQYCVYNPVPFLNSTPGSVDAWLWDFGDGETSTYETPVHYYDTVGVYDVSLTAFTGCGDAYLLKEEFIEIFPAGDCGGPIPTELQGPQAEVSGDAIVISWSITPPSPYAGYQIQRSEHPSGPFVILNPDPIRDLGGLMVQSYEYRDETAVAGTEYYYRLLALWPNGLGTSFPVPYTIGLPPGEDRFDAVWLSLARPSPFRTSVELALGLPQGETRLELSVYNSRGRKVRTIAAGSWSGGRHLFSWDGMDELGHHVPPGVYFVRLVTAEGSLTRKTLLVR